MATTPRPPDQPDPAANTQGGPEFAPTLAGGKPKPPAATFPPEAWQLLQDLQLHSTPASPDTAFLTPPPGVLPAVAGYELLEELGRGGMGVVYRAKQVSLNRVVALKMIGAADRANRQDIARFLVEAEAVAAVRHPNVVEVYDLGQHAGRPFYTMEFVDGGSLSRLLAKSGRLAPADAAAVLAAVARGVHAAHLAGIVHRDLKPGNILLGNAECGMRNAESEPKTSGGSGLNSAFRIPHSAFQPKVSDFGLAKRLGAVEADALTRTRAVLGTPTYMAPEQAGGRAKFVGPGADVYALGVILYQCLTGDVPFRDTDDNNWALLRRVIDEPPVPPRRHVSEIPRDLDLICLKCLEKDPDDRYPTAEALADDLDRFLAGRPVSVRPVSAASRAWRWVKRHPAPAALAALVAVLAVGVPPLVVWNQGKLDKSRAVAAEAENARVAAVALADVRELFGLQSTARRRAADRPTGWTWENRTDLAKAAALAGGEPATTADLRSDAVTALLAADLRPAEPIARNLTTAVMTPSPDGTLLALGEFKTWGTFNVPGLPAVTSCRVLLVDPGTGELKRELAFPAEKVSGSSGQVQDGTRAIAFGPGGRLFVGSRAGSIHRFDLNQPGGKPARSWKAGGEVNRLAVSADGAAVFSAGADPAVVKWDADSGKEQARAAVRGGIHHGLLIDPAGGDLIAGDGDGLVRFDPKTLKPRATAGGFPGMTRQVAVAAGGRALVVAAGDQVELADPASLGSTAQFTDPGLRTVAHEDAVAGVAVHPSGMYVASASEHDRQVKVWEIAAGRLVGSVPVPGTGFIAVAWSGDGRFLLATAPSQVLRWEFAVPPAARFAVANAYPALAAAFTADGKEVVALTPTAAGNRELLCGGTAVRIPTGPGRSRPGVAVSPANGTVAVTRAGTGIVTWKPGAVAPVVGFTPESAWCPRYSPDGATLWAVVDSSKVQAWDATTGTPRGTWENAAARIILGLPALEALAVGPTKAAVGGQDGAVHVFNPKVEQVAAFPHAGDPVQAVAITPDESLVVAGTRAGRVRIIRLADGTELPARDAHPGGVTAAAVSRDGMYLATGGKDRTVKVWRRTADGFEWLFAATDLPAPVAALEFGPTDLRLLVLLTNDHAARVWDVTTLRDQLKELGLGW